MVDTYSSISALHTTNEKAFCLSIYPSLSTNFAVLLLVPIKNEVMQGTALPHKLVNNVLCGALGIVKASSMANYPGIITGLR